MIREKTFHRIIFLVYSKKNEEPLINNEVKTPSKIRPWIIWGVAALFPMYQFLLQGSPSVMLPDLTQDLSITYIQASFITTYFFYTYIIMQVPAGILVDVFGPRILLTVGSLLAGIACIAFSCCKELWIARSSRLLMGFVCAPGIVAAFYLIAHWFESKRFALLVGFTETFGFAGTAIGTILLSATVNKFGWRTAIFLCGVAGVTLCLFILFIIRNDPKDNSLVSKNFGKFSLAGEIRSLGVIVSRSQIWINGLYIGLAFSAIPAFFSLWGIPFFMNHYGLSSTGAAAVVAVGFIGAGIGGPFLGWLSDHIGRRKIIIILGALVSVVCVWIIIHIKAPLGIMFLLNFLLGFSISGYVLSFAIIKEILPQEVKGKAMGFANMLCLAIGAPFLQPIIAHLMKGQEMTSNTFKIALTPLPIVLTLSFILSFFIKETYCKDVSEKKAPAG